MGGTIVAGDVKSRSSQISHRFNNTGKTLIYRSLNTPARLSDGAVQISDLTIRGTIR